MQQLFAWLVALILLRFVEEGRIVGWRGTLASLMPMDWLAYFRTRGWDDAEEGPSDLLYRSVTCVCSKAQPSFSHGIVGEKFKGQQALGVDRSP